MSDVDRSDWPRLARGMRWMEGWTTSEIAWSLGASCRLVRQLLSDDVLDGEVRQVLRGPDRYGSNFSCHCLFGRINSKCKQKPLPGLWFA